MAGWPDEEPEHTVPPVIRGGQDSFTGQAPAAGEPGIVYLPAQRSQQGGALEIELRHLGDDRLALLAYSSLDLLVAGCGEKQPWVAIRLDSSNVEDLASRTKADEVLWNVDVPPALRHGSPEGEKD